MNPLSAILTEAQIRALGAACDRILPADDYPSAWEAGAESYFARIFADEPETAVFIGLLLKSLDRESAELGGVPFAELPNRDQDHLLSAMEFADNSGAFTRLVELVIESYYADPGNGGNREKASWLMVGFEVTA